MRQHAPSTVPRGTQAKVLFGLAAVLVVVAGIAGATCGECGTGEGHVRMLLPLLLAGGLGVAGLVMLSGSMLRHPAARPRSPDEARENFMALDGRPTAGSWQADVRKHRNE